ncbi:RNA polymerase sigma factor SigJ [Streptomyces sp. S07_1.15]|uniref:RNA polymerase sigma factor SigJ n=1 Tax=Streptomyces sp. S07_1.15 TaxID=2873925 RepID=UPI001D159F92|nr:RNA polymerase sigma factor SigJ [Streptomyces sp. S07_1.15]MCC3650074.1 RNA polymerase sigma factor SigJ [Streptomyces sp. S07_1.15]
MATDTATDVFEKHRPLLTGVAYRMLGRAADAEDAVQETWLRWSAADRAEVREPRAYLVRITTRLALDRLRQLRAQRETYVGPWLPEPVGPEFAGAVPDAGDRVVLAESVSFAVLVVLESLSPLERAVFVLREAFGFPYAEIARALDREPAAVRQLATRARRHVGERKPRYRADPDQQRELTERFLAAAAGADLGALLELLAPDARLVGDSGGRAKAPLRVMESAGKIARFLAAVAGELDGPAVEFVRREFNGAPAVLVLLGGRPDTVVSVDVTAEGRIACVYLVRNPEKLAAVTV